MLELLYWLLVLKNKPYEKKLQTECLSETCLRMNRVLRSRTSSSKHQWGDTNLNKFIVNNGAEMFKIRY